MNRFFRTVLMGVCLTLLLGAGMPAHAQTTRTLTIQGGQVWIDDQLVPAEDLPASLEVEGIDQRSIFVGNPRPMISLNNVLYVLDGPHLREVADLRNEEGGLVVFFRDGSYAPYQVQEGDLAFRADDQQQDQDTPVALMKQYAQALQASSEELGKLSREAENSQAIEQARRQVQQAAQVAQTLPRLEVQSYLSEVQQQDQDLYALLVREWSLEAEAQSLALKIQALPDGEERRQRIEDLRNRLDAMFEMKQENRRREIQQLERQLEDLHLRLQKREEYRDRIIQQRLKELIGNSR